MGKMTTEQIGGNVITWHAPDSEELAVMEAERRAAEDAENARREEVKTKLTALKEKKEATLEDVLELLLLVAEKVGVGSTNG